MEFYEAELIRLVDIVSRRISRVELELLQSEAELARLAALADDPHEPLRP
jgi:hypothetical protein